MSHVRQQIRAATVAALAPIGGVFASRTIPIESPELPVILVYTNDETIDRATMGAYQRSLNIVVEIVEKGRSVDDDLDALIVRVEDYLNDSKLGGLCKPLAPTGIDVTVDVIGNTPIGRAKITYRVTYFTHFSNPETAV
jgi:hypothetical protein